MSLSPRMCSENTNISLSTISRYPIVQAFAEVLQARISDYALFTLKQFVVVVVVVAVAGNLQSLNFF